MFYKTGFDHRGCRLFLLGKALPPLPENQSSEISRPDWMQAKAPEIQKNLQHALSLPSGGWLVVDASSRITARPAFYWINGKEYVAWRDKTNIPRIAPNRCPHMGAPLSAGHTKNGQLVCPWHGLKLNERKHGSWELLDCFNDGILFWVRIPTSEPTINDPILAPRPTHYMANVLRVVARCDPADVIANRLDPWHGAHYHPHTFARLKILNIDNHVLTVRVAYRLIKNFCIEVDCTFHCPEPRTIIMTIIAGEGKGSVVETHATPIAPGRTAIIEATLATSARPGFRLALYGASIAKYFMQQAARRLWLEDAAYAERIYFLRNGAASPSWLPEDWIIPPGTPHHQ